MMVIHFAGVRGAKRSVFRVKPMRVSRDNSGTPDTFSEVTGHGYERNAYRISKNPGLFGD